MCQIHESLHKQNLWQEAFVHVSFPEFYADPSYFPQVSQC